MAQLVSLLQAVNALSPLGVIALLTVVIFLLVSKRGPMRRLTDNHAAHMQDSLAQIAATMDRVAASSDKQLDALTGIKTDIAIVKDRLSR